MTYSSFSYVTVPQASMKAEYSQSNLIAVYDIDDLIENARLDDRITDVEWTVNVTNTGKVTSDVVVLAFVSSNSTIPGVSPPIKELFDYARVSLLIPGQTVTLIFGLSYRVLNHYDDEGHSWLLPGDYKLAVNNEEDTTAIIRLKGEPALIEDYVGAKHPPVKPVLTTPTVTASTDLKKGKANKHIRKNAKSRD